MKRISDLSGALIGEIFYRVPLTSLHLVRSTCKKWNDLTKNRILGKKAAARSQFLEFMMTNSTLSSFRFNLQGIENKDDQDLLDHLSIKQITSIPNNNQVEISQVFHCDGLLLCVSRDHLTLFVWNPYLGQTRLVQPRNKLNICDRYAIGYDNDRNHKILRLVNDGRPSKILIDVYDFSSDSWRFLDVDPSTDVEYHNGLSLKGNTYFFGQEVTTTGIVVPNQGETVTDIEDYLVCFDFTRESFGPRLPLPFDPPYPCFECVSLSWVRDEKLAVLYSHYETPEIIEIWITTKIELNAVSWSSFLKLDLSLINGLPDGFSFDCEPSSFFIDEEKKIAVLFDYDGATNFRYQMAYIIGGDGSFKSVNTGIVSNPRFDCGKLVCSSYVPSLVHVQVN
ncbi:unnamed protein product [Microthlaspi erraticum]|uniref:F-box domain-containing protein n=1 Tax=Microthlaspi erraticum TaxID=1685480 RepID=A0A6D2LBU1_9BRAS|nr:unnamed protein product [Microthlaspi erraticum]